MNRSPQKSRNWEANMNKVPATSFLPLNPQRRDPDKSLLGQNCSKTAVLARAVGTRVWTPWFTRDWSRRRAEGAAMMAPHSILSQSTVNTKLWQCFLSNESQHFIFQFLPEIISLLEESKYYDEKNYSQFHVENAQQERQDAGGTFKYRQG